MADKTSTSLHTKSTRGSDNGSDCLAPARPGSSAPGLGRSAAAVVFSHGHPPKATFPQGLTAPTSNLMHRNTL